jgi:glycosyltransferase involved in cell wall biosynthesis
MMIAGTELPSLQEDADTAGSTFSKDPEESHPGNGHCSYSISFFPGNGLRQDRPEIQGSCGINLSHSGRTPGHECRNKIRSIHPVLLPDLDENHLQPLHHGHLSHRLCRIGEGPIREKLEASGSFLPNKPEFLTLTPEELVHYYNLADLYVHAACVEVECMTALEAMGCGLPLLIADSPKSASKQFALDQQSLFPVDQVSELTGKINYWIEHPEELKKAGKRYLEYSEHYRIEKSFEKLEEIYLDLAKSRLKSKVSSDQS